MTSEPYFRHKTTGVLQYDPKQGTRHFEPWWALLQCDEGIVGLYAWLLKSYGMASDPNKLWGAHVSVVKGEQPARPDLWGAGAGTAVEFSYTDQIRWDNDRHAWLDCFSPQMSEIRDAIGLPPKCFFHLTLGRLR